MGGRSHHQLNSSFNNGKYQIINLSSPFSEFVQNTNAIVESGFYGSRLNGLINSNHEDDQGLELEEDDDKEQICMLNSQELPFMMKSSETKHFPNLTHTNYH